MSDRRKITGRLGYNQENRRYGLLVTDLWEKEGFHCEDGLEVMVNVSCVKNVFILVS